MSKLANLTGFLDRLDEAEIFYTLQSIHEGAICVAVTVPGQRWEVEFHNDGDVEVEVFERVGEIRDVSAIEEMFDRAEDTDDG